VPFSFEEVLQFDPLTLPKLSDLFVRMLYATVLGSAVAFRFWRRFMPFVSKPSLQSAQSQTLIAAAGAVMVVVIGDNPARAFGLVGLGSFIRFRSGISDPRDAAVMFVMIGIGMASGLGLFSMAAAATLFICALLTIFDYGARKLTRPTVLSIQAEDAQAVRARLPEIFPAARLLAVSNNAPELGKEAGKVMLELPLRPDQGADDVQRILEGHGVQGVRRIAIETPD
jgi:uncharacterized membrane protein YhiD involved in acid resistance